MLSKRFLYILIGIAVLGFGSYTFWQVTKHQASKVVTVFKVTPVNEAIKALPKQVPLEENANRQHAAEVPTNGIAFVKSRLTEEQLAAPGTKKLFKILESEEFLKFMETRPTLEEEFHFLADRGVDVPRNINMKMFRESFPTGEPADYEPEMREKLTQMFIEAGIGNPGAPPPAEVLAIRERFQTTTEFQEQLLEPIQKLLDQYGNEDALRRIRESDPVLAVGVQYLIQKEQENDRKNAVIQAFLKDRQNLHWQMGYFQGSTAKMGLVLGLIMCLPIFRVPHPLLNQHL